MDWDLKPVIGLPPTTTGLVLLPENKPEHSYAAVSRSGIVNMHLSEEQRKRIEEHNQSVAEFERT
jgi:excisionase family DNA binding protein